jgi:hypothetical protein
MLLTFKDSKPANYSHLLSTSNLGSSTRSQSPSRIWETVRTCSMRLILHEKSTAYLLSTSFQHISKKADRELLFEVVDKNVATLPHLQHRLSGTLKRNGFSSLLSLVMGLCPPCSELHIPRLLDFISPSGFFFNYSSIPNMHIWNRTGNI